MAQLASSHHTVDNGSRLLGFHPPRGEGSLQALLLALCIHDIDTARGILEAYLAEYVAYLPQFHPDSGQGSA